MAAILKVWRLIELPLRQSMHIYVESIPDKFHPDPDPIWNDGTLIFKDGHPSSNNNKDKMSSGDMYPFLM